MQSNKLPWLDIKGIKRIPAFIVGVLALYFIMAYLISAAATLGYPYQIEWLEGGMLSTIQRVTRGLPVYTAPTLEYSPFLYTPFYYYVSASLAYLYGVNFTTARIVSFCACIATCAILYQWLRKEGADKLLAIAASALFLSTYVITGRWFNMAKTDSLFLALTFGGLFTYACYRSNRTACIAGILLALAFFTKQQALLIALIALAAGIPAYPKRTLLTLGTFILLVAAMVLLYNATTDGWFDIYVFEVPWVYPKKFVRWHSFVEHDMFSNMPVAIVLSIAGILCLLRYNWRRGFVYGGLLAAAIIASLGSRIHNGGFVNVLMPAFCALSLVCVLSLHTITRHRPSLRNAGLLLLAAQMAMLFYNPLRYLPSPQNYEAGQLELNYIASLPGDVLIPEMRFMQQAAGKNDFGLGMESTSAESESSDKTYVRIRRQLKRAIRERQFSAIITSRPAESLPGMQKYYRFKEKILNDNNTYLLVNGGKKTPNFVYVPIDSTLPQEHDK